MTPERPWTRYYDEGVPATVRYPDVPLQAFLDDTARQMPDAPGTIFFDGH